MFAEISTVVLVFFPRWPLPLSVTLSLSRSYLSRWIFVTSLMKIPSIFPHIFHHKYFS